MKFDVVIGNPPYQKMDGGFGPSAVPIYDKFVSLAKKINPRFIVMIIPARWFTCGRDLGKFREEMLHDRRISHIVDFPLASDVFPCVLIAGGVCFFLWERDYNGPCKITTRTREYSDSMVRPLDQFDVLVRFNKAIPILEKVMSKGYPSMSLQVSRQHPFGFRTFVKPSGSGSVTLYANKAVGKIESDKICLGIDIIDKWKVLISRLYNDRSVVPGFMRPIIGKPIVAPPPSACTGTYIVVGAYDTEREAHNLAVYLRTKFLRFLVGLRKNCQNFSRDRFAFVPIIPMDTVWTDEKLYEHFGLNDEEIAFIESVIAPMS
ncbi:MAG: hypothetical protein D6735_15480 [Acidobacteria bacterium]|nr:MAG: hypothetical protein D6735_15480 [Acidobacteriota bacterium]